MNNNQVSSNNKLLRSVGVIILGLIIFSLFFDLFFGSTPGSAGPDAMHGGPMPAGSGFSLSTLIANILILLTKLLSIMLAVGLIAGTWVLIRDFVLVDQGTGLMTSLTKSLGLQAVQCPKCGKTVKSQWDYCPDCGNSLESEVNQVNSNTQS